MNTLLKTLLLTFLVSSTALADPGKTSGKKDHPTKLARYQVGTYITVMQKLRVNIDKQLGGEVSIKLTDAKGNLYYDHTLTSVDTIARLSLDLSDLNEGEYQLKITNGLEMEVRDIKISAKEPVVQSRKLTVL
ncbi:MULTISPECIES: hypothetical protein [unclassified Spirosoma]|uniref:hypothetical protein n=1 Tax=unclassified Spirosoma TaxID=2621999 RepID=UPI00096612F4|nr:MULTISPECIES: hypothetical protein [unclassified Spirosoma]MBN8822920.1 hypothetical protein [Spirosoma sp.]OJW80106.1 MAG: hypothetical protein BGO59_02565 [Spirosoma sp. 48-14]